MIRLTSRALLLVCIAVGAGAQGVPQVKLKPANATIDREFTRITSARELSDGTLLVFDDTLFSVDFKAGTLNRISRPGRGPNEYFRSTSLVALPGDSTLITGFDRWLILAGTRIVKMIPADDSLVAAARRGVTGVDSRGRALVVRNAGRGSGDPAAPIDSPYLAFLDRNTRTFDTLGRLRPIPSGEITGSMKDGRGNTVPVYTVREPLVADEAVLFKDGWVAVARVYPYRVDWLDPSRRWIRGPALAAQTVNTYRERLAAAQRQSRKSGKPAYEVQETGYNGPTTIPEYMSFDWATFLMAPDGRLVIKRSQTADFEFTRYDVVDRAGKVNMQLTMPETEFIVSFGAKSVYVVAADDDGIQRLRRHPWP